MERCAAAGISNLPSILPNPIASKRFHSISLCRTQFPFARIHTRSISGLKFYANSSQRPTTAGETSSHNKDKPEHDGFMRMKGTHLDDKKEDFDTPPNGEQQESVFSNISLQLSKFFENFDIKFSYEEYYPILAFGGGGVVALWFLASVVDAIESIPLFPKVLELIGLGYTLWFSSRFLIFKENRDELVAKIEQVKNQMLGSEDD